MAISRASTMPDADNWFPLSLLIASQAPAVNAMKTVSVSAKHFFNILISTSSNLYWRAPAHLFGSQSRI
jgi:hypothetical protein